MFHLAKVTAQYLQSPYFIACGQMFPLLLEEKGLGVRKSDNHPFQTKELIRLGAKGSRKLSLSVDDTNDTAKLHHYIPILIALPIMFIDELHFQINHYLRYVFTKLHQTTCWSPLP